MLTEQGIPYDCVLYLDDGLSLATLQSLLVALGFTSVRDMMRSKEPLYKALGLDNEGDEAVLLQALVNHPKLLERPIVVYDNRAQIGRPPEAVMRLFLI